MSQREVGADHQAFHPKLSQQSGDELRSTQLRKLASEFDWDHTANSRLVQQFETRLKVGYVTQLGSRIEHTAGAILEGKNNRCQTFGLRSFRQGPQQVAMP
jgi:hypothetical protein